MSAAVAIAAIAILSGPQARAEIRADEPAAQIRHCERQAPRAIRCRVLVPISATPEVIDAGSGQVVGQGPPTTIGLFPLNVEVTPRRLRWSIPPEYVS